ncbi:MAG: GGDEF domain-containing protein [Desulfobacteraceae bacterium]|nr:GGDEF domain-containing protein [Desulfobacteraceae bacterium]
MGSAPLDACLGKLSEIVIDTLKALSVDAVVITPRMLQESLSGRKELVALMRTAPSPGSGCQPSGPGTSHPAHVAGNSECGSVDKLRRLLREALEDIEENSAALVPSTLSDIRKSTRETDRLDHLVDAGEEIFRIIRSNFNYLSAQTSQVAHLLAHLEEGMFEMERCLRTGFQDEDTADGETRSPGIPGREETGDGEFSPAERNIGELKSLIEGKLPFIKSMIEQKKRKTDPPAGSQRKTDDMARRMAEMRNQLSRAREKTRVLEIGLFRDPLTGVYNRRACRQRIAAEFKNYQRSQQVFSALSIEVDNLHAINERFGDAAGDGCLKELAGIMRDTLRGSDFLARSCENGFVAILPRTSEDILPIVAERLYRNAEKASFRHRHEEFRVAVRIGAAHATPSDRDGEEILKRAEQSPLPDKRLAPPSQKTEAAEAGLRQAPVSRRTIPEARKGIALRERTSLPAGR